MLGRRHGPQDAWVPDERSDDSVVLRRAVQRHLPGTRRRLTATTFGTETGAGTLVEMDPGPALDASSTPTRPPTRQTSGGHLNRPSEPSPPTSSPARTSGTG